MSKNRRMRRKIPILNVSLKDGATYDQLCEIPEMKILVMETTKAAITDGIKNNKKSITLFEIANTTYTIELDKSQWIKSLENIIGYYAEKEDYNACIDIKDLIKQIK
jgi:hypothetical protein